MTSVCAVYLDRAGDDGIRAQAEIEAAEVAMKAVIDDCVAARIK
jgi:hypothetical protein